MDIDAEIVKDGTVATSDDGAVVCKTFDGGQRRFVLEDQLNNEWCDIELFGKDTGIGKSGIKCHKMVLASVSAHLHDAFKSEGFIDSRAKEYHIDEIDDEILKIIVGFVYSNKLQLAGKSISDRLKLVLVGADYLLMPALVELCGKSLDDPAFLNTGCAINMWLFARKYHCKGLEDAAVRTIASDLHAIIAQDVYLELEGEDVLNLLKALLHMPESVKTPPADLKCAAAVAWLGFKTDERKVKCDEIMRQIPLKEMSVGALKLASETNFLSEQILWTVKQLRELKDEILRLRIENISLTTKNISVDFEKGIASTELNHANAVSEERRKHLMKMYLQAVKLEDYVKRHIDHHAVEEEKKEAWFNKGKKKRADDRHATEPFR